MVHSKGVLCPFLAQLLPPFPPLRPFYLLKERLRAEKNIFLSAGYFRLLEGGGGYVAPQPTSRRRMPRRIQGK